MSILLLEIKEHKENSGGKDNIDIETLNGRNSILKCYFTYFSINSSTFSMIKTSEILNNKLCQ